MHTFNIISLLTHNSVGSAETPARWGMGLVHQNAFILCIFTFLLKLQRLCEIFHSVFSFPVASKTASDLHLGLKSSYDSTKIGCFLTEV